MEGDARRSARLVAPELGDEPVLDGALARRLAPPVPHQAVRMAQLALSKLRSVNLARRSLAPAVAARRELLGGSASASPRFLVRVDEFPYATSFDEPERYGVEPSSRFHAAFADAGVPYLMAIVPQLVRQPLDPAATGGRPLGPAERELISRMAADRVAFAAHGLTHRTRDASPRRHSELLGLSAAETTDLADRSLELLAEVDVRPSVFVPPFNRLARPQYDALTSRFDVICGGPETVAFLGAQPTPRWLGDAVYCPSYPPLYGRAREILPEVRRLIAERPGTWVPVTLHLAWELDDGLEDMRRLLELLAPHAVSWGRLLDALDASRPGSSGHPDRR
jgi:peptidoglycan/xylan/chitin deacetylase (PgdA/CDA1 family)